MFTPEQIDAVSRIRSEIRQAEEALIQGVLGGRLSGEMLATTRARLERAAEACRDYPAQG